MLEKNCAFLPGHSEDILKEVLCVIPASGERKYVFIDPAVILPAEVFKVLHQHTSHLFIARTAGCHKLIFWKRIRAKLSPAKRPGIILPGRGMTDKTHVLCCPHSDSHLCLSLATASITSRPE